MITSRLCYSQFKMPQFKVVRPLEALTLNGLIPVHKSIKSQSLAVIVRESSREAIKHHWHGDLITISNPTS